MLEEETTDLNQKRKTKKVNWTKIRAVHFDRPFPFNIVYNYILDVAWQTVDTEPERVRFRDGFRGSQVSRDD